GNIDVALLPIGGRDFTMDLHEALQAARRINPKVIIPMHRFESDPVQYKNLVEKDSSTKVEPLGIGETYQL
ncbi:MAG: MBL fold metallo-hydrolase, partial [Desulfobacterales bacterium]